MYLAFLILILRKVSGVGPGPAQLSQTHFKFRVAPLERFFAVRISSKFQLGDLTRNIFGDLPWMNQADCTLNFLGQNIRQNFRVVLIKY